MMLNTQPKFDKNSPKTTMSIRFILGSLVVLFLGTAAFAQVDSQWRGPYRTGIYPNEKLLDSWPEGGPNLVWSAEGLGDGYSSPAVTADRVYLTGLISGEGWLFAYDKDGQLLWKSSYGIDWSGSHPRPGRGGAIHLSAADPSTDRESRATCHRR